MCETLNGPLHRRRIKRPEGPLLWETYSFFLTRTLFFSFSEHRFFPGVCKGRAWTHHTSKMSKEEAKDGEKKVIEADARCLALTGRISKSILEGMTKGSDKVNKSLADSECV